MPEPSRDALRVFTRNKTNAAHGTESTCGIQDRLKTLWTFFYQLRSAHNTERLALGLRGKIPAGGAEFISFARNRSALLLTVRFFHGNAVGYWRNKP